MKKSIYAIMLGALILLGFSSAVLSASAVKLSDPLGIGDKPDAIKILLLKIAGGIGTLIASLGIIMIIWSAMLFLTSAGSPEKLAKAKTALTYAIIGIAVGISATAIVNVILNVLKG